MKYDIVKRRMSLQFRRLGRSISRRPSIPIFVCLGLSAILGTGIHRACRVTDLEYLYSPINGRAKSDRKAIETLFPANRTNHYDFLRITRFGKMGIVHAMDKDSGSMLSEKKLEELFRLDELIRNLTVYHNNRGISYEDICSKTMEGICFNNFPLSLPGNVKEIKERITHIRYPIDFIKRFPVITAVNLGGLTLGESGHIIDFRAVRMFYVLDSSTEEKNTLSSLWEEEFLEEVSRRNFTYLNVERASGSSMNSETSRITEMVFPLLFITAPVILIFTSLSCTTLNAVTSKPWLGIAGCASALLSTVTAFGLLLYCNVYYVDLNISVSFLVLGIGIDDSFVLLAAWRRTNAKDTVEDRMGEAFSEAAVSVTITSLTNFISFCVGIVSPYRSIRIFSVYSALSLLFAYIYQLLFFGGCLAIDGYREERRLNGFTFVPVKREDISEILPSRKKKSSLCLNEVNAKQHNTKSEKQFYRDILGNALANKNIKIIVLVIFLGYFGGGVYCLTWVKEGLEYLSVLPQSSFLYNFTITHYKYFIDYPHRIHLVINTTLDYSDQTVQDDINNLITEFQSLPDMADVMLVESWLSEYLTFIKEPLSNIPLKGYNISNHQDFLEGLKIFLRMGWAKRFQNDILFNNDGTKIIAARFLLQSKGVGDANAEKTLLQNLRSVADKSKYPIYIHNLWFVMYDQYLGVVETALQTICVAAILVTLVFAIFIPNVICVASVVLTITCIQVGVIGYMSLWNVNLDAVSMIILVMCTGFSVDYAAHISYSYITCKCQSPNEKIKISLHAAAHPIVQGCTSTVLAVSVLYFGPSYMFVIFFKIILLLMVLAAFHGIFLLPVILSTSDLLLSCSYHADKSKSEPVDADNESNDLMDLNTVT